MIIAATQLSITRILQISHVNKVEEKILFIIPSYNNSFLDIYTKTTNVIPYGVLSIASYLEHYIPNVKTQILDFNIIEKGKSTEQILTKTIENYNPDMIGLSLMYNSCINSLDKFARIIKSYRPGIFLFAGGILATNNP